MELLRVGAEEFRRKLSDLLNRVGYGKDRVIVERHGSPVAVLVPYEVYAAFEKFMDSRGELHLPAVSVWKPHLTPFGAEWTTSALTYDELAQRYAARSGCVPCENTSPNSIKNTYRRGKRMSNPNLLRVSLTPMCSIGPATPPIDRTASVVVLESGPSDPGRSDHARYTPGRGRCAT